MREGHEAARGRMEAATGQVSGRRVIPDADQGGDPGRSEAAHGLFGKLPDLGASRMSLYRADSELDRLCRLRACALPWRG